MPSWWSNDNGWKIIKSFSCSLSRWFQSLGTPKKSELKYYICTWFIKFKQISKDVFSICKLQHIILKSSKHYYKFLLLFFRRQQDIQRQQELQRQAQAQAQAEAQARRQQELAHQDQQRRLAEEAQKKVGNKLLVFLDTNFFSHNFSHLILCTFLFLLFTLILFVISSANATIYPVGPRYRSGHPI